MKAIVLEGVMAVLRRLMKAVFFFKDESSELLVGKTSSEASVQKTGNIRAQRWYSCPLPKPERWCRASHLF